MRLTVGSLPPAVYWRRRAFVLGTILLVLFLVAQACMAASASPERRAGDRVDTGATSPPASPAPASPVPPASPPATPAAGQGGTPTGPDGRQDEDRCTDDEMLIIAEAEETSFPSGTSVQFTILIQNDSGRGCVRDVGPDQRELYLRRDTGAGKIWSSRACAELTGRDVRELEPTFQSAHWVVWNGRTSDSCDGAEPAGAVLEAGEYELVARLGTAYSEPVRITVS